MKILKNPLGTVLEGLLCFFLLEQGLVFAEHSPESSRFLSPLSPFADSLIAALITDPDGPDDEVSGIRDNPLTEAEEADVDSLVAPPDSAAPAFEQGTNFQRSLETGILDLSLEDFEALLRRNQSESVSSKDPQAMLKWAQFQRDLHFLMEQQLEFSAGNVPEGPLDSLSRAVSGGASDHIPHFWLQHVQTREKILKVVEVSRQMLRAGAPANRGVLPLDSLETRLKEGESLLLDRTLKQYFQASLSKELKQALVPMIQVLAPLHLVKSRMTRALDRTQTILSGLEKTIAPTADTFLQTRNTRTLLSQAEGVLNDFFPQDDLQHLNIQLLQDKLASQEQRFQKLALQNLSALRQAVALQLNDQNVHMPSFEDFFPLLSALNQSLSETVSYLDPNEGADLLQLIEFQKQLPKIFDTAIRKVSEDLAGQLQPGGVYDEKIPWKLEFLAKISPTLDQLQKDGVLDQATHATLRDLNDRARASVNSSLQGRMDALTVEMEQLPQGVKKALSTDRIQSEEALNALFSAHSNLNDWLLFFADIPDTASIQVEIPAGFFSRVSRSLQAVSSLLQAKAEETRAGIQSFYGSLTVEQEQSPFQDSPWAHSLRRIEEIGQRLLPPSASALTACLEEEDRTALLASEETRLQALLETQEFLRDIQGDTLDRLDGEVGRKIGKTNEALSTLRYGDSLHTASLRRVLDFFLNLRDGRLPALMQVAGRFGVHFVGLADSANQRMQDWFSRFQNRFLKHFDEELFQLETIQHEWVDSISSGKSGVASSESNRRLLIELFPRIQQRLSWMEAFSRSRAFANLPGRTPVDYERRLNSLSQIPLRLLYRLKVDLKQGTKSVEDKVSTYRLAIVELEQMLSSLKEIESGLRLPEAYSGTIEEWDTRQLQLEMDYYLLLSQQRPTGESRIEMNALARKILDRILLQMDRDGISAVLRGAMDGFYTAYATHLSDPANRPNRPVLTQTLLKLVFSSALPSENALAKNVLIPWLKAEVSTAQAALNQAYKVYCRDELSGRFPPLMTPGSKVSVWENNFLKARAEAQRLFEVFRDWPRLTQPLPELLDLRDSLEGTLNITDSEAQKSWKVEVFDQLMNSLGQQDLQNIHETLGAPNADLKGVLGSFKSLRSLIHQGRRLVKLLGSDPGFESQVEAFRQFDSSLQKEIETEIQGMIRVNAGLATSLLSSSAFTDAQQGAVLQGTLPEFFADQRFLILKSLYAKDEKDPWIATECLQNTEAVVNALKTFLARQQDHLRSLLDSALPSGTDKQKQALEARLSAFQALRDANGLALSALASLNELMELLEAGGLKNTLVPGFSALLSGLEAGITLSKSTLADTTQQRLPSIVKEYLTLENPLAKTKVVEYESLNQALRSAPAESIQTLSPSPEAGKPDAASLWGQELVEQAGRVIDRFKEIAPASQDQQLFEGLRTALSQGIRFVVVDKTEKELLGPLGYFAGIKAEQEGQKGPVHLFITQRQWSKLQAGNPLPLAKARRYLKAFLHGLGAQSGLALDFNNILADLIVARPPKSKPENLVNSKQKEISKLLSVITKLQDKGKSSFKPLEKPRPGQKNTVVVMEGKVPLLPSERDQVSRWFRGWGIDFVDVSALGSRWNGDSETVSLEPGLTPAEIEVAMALKRLGVKEAALASRNTGPVPLHLIDSAA